jgi:hypothetical protein
MAAAHSPQRSEVMSLNEPVPQSYPPASSYAPASDDRPGMRGAILPAALLVIVGAIQVIMGLQAVHEKGFFETPPNGYYYNWDPDFWGWVHIIFGVILAISGVFVLMRRGWAAYLAVSLAGLSAIWNFFLILFFPLWTIITIALDILIIWSVSRSDVMEDW